jgi:DNA-binding transcriptional LysR family regulator
MTQSAVSNALKRLRTAFDDPLFVKTAEGMMPTSFADRIAEPMHTALLQLKHAIEDRGQFDAATSERTFRLYLSDVGQMTLLPPLLELTRREASELTFETCMVGPSQAAELMAKGEIDLAVGLFDAFGEAFFRQRVTQERMVCLLRADHPAIGEKLTLTQYLNAKHAVFRPVAGNHMLIDEQLEKMFQEHGTTRRVVLRLAHSLGIASMLSNSDIIMTVPSRLAQSYAYDSRLRALELPFESPTFDISQHWHKRCDRDPGHVWLRSVMRKVSRK